MMKKAVVIFVFITFFLTGCNQRDAGMDRALKLREQLQQNAASFEVQITADYGESLYTFKMSCSFDTNGDMTFTVTEPDTIYGITGTITQANGNLTFDEQVLAFELLADGQITPVSAPWILIKTLRSGYIRGVGENDDSLKLIIDDSYEEDSLQLDIWLDENNHPVEAEILWQGRRFLSLKINNFSCV